MAGLNDFYTGIGRDTLERGINPPVVLPPPQRRGGFRPKPRRRPRSSFGGRGFLATFMKLAQRVIPSTRREMERRLRSKLKIQSRYGGEEEDNAPRSAALGSGGYPFYDNPYRFNSRPFKGDDYI